MIVVLAALLDMLLGDPQRFPHPVRAVGNLISYLEASLYRPHDKARGAAFAGIVIAVVACVVQLSVAIASLIPGLGMALNVYLLYAAIGWRSLKDETAPVAAALDRGDLGTARYALSRIVGRDTDDLDEPAIVRAAVETVGENAVDGVFSVLFYATLGGIAGYPALFVWVFKTVSTLDSMIGYRDERYCDFGTFSARLDDVLNFVPARLGAALMLLGGFVAGFSPNARIAQGILRDRLKHPSPNSAHGESVMAWLLGITLGGRSRYRGVVKEKPVLGEPTRDPEPDDIARACTIMDAGVVLFLLACLFFEIV